MSNYLPIHRKKQDILDRKEDKLRRLLSQSADESKLLKWAGEIRVSRVRAMQARKAQLSPKDTFALKEQVKHIDAKIEAIKATTPEIVLAEFRTNSK